MATPISPAGSNDQDTPPISRHLHPCCQRGVNLQTVGSPPRPDALSLSPGDGTEVVAPRGAQGGGATPGRKPRRFVMQRNCSHRVMHRRRAAPSRLRPILPLPRNYRQNSQAERARRHPPFGSSRRQQWLHVTAMANACPRTPGPRLRGHPPSPAGVGSAKGTWGRRSLPAPPEPAVTPARREGGDLTTHPQHLGALISILLIKQPCPPPAPDPLVRRSPQITDVEIRP